MTARLTPKRIRDQQDFNATPGSGNDGYAVVYDHGSGKFALSRMQPYDAELAAIAGLTSAADRLAYFTGSGTAELATFTSFGRSIVDDADASTARTTLGLGTAAVLNVGTSANNVVQLDGSARLPAVNGSLLTGIVATASPAGSNTQVQYNNAGAFAGDDGLTYNASTDRLTVTGGLVAPSMRPASDSTTAFKITNAAGATIMLVDSTNKRVGFGGDFPTYGLGGIEDAIVTVKAPALTHNGNTIAYLAAFNRVNSDIAAWFLGSEGASAPYGAVLITNNGNLKIGSDYSGTFTTHLFMGGQISSSLYGRFGVGVNNTSPTALFDLAASTATRASLRIRAGTAPSSPNAGEIYFNGTNFFGYNGSEWKQLDN